MPACLQRSNEIKPSYEWEGIVSQQVVETICGELRSLIAPRVESRRMAAVAVELLQNALFHGLVSPLHGGVFCRVVFTPGKQHWALLVVNEASAEKARDVSAKVSELSRMDRDTLALLIRNRRKAPVNPLSSTAGLGLLDILRKSGHNLSCSCEPVGISGARLSMQVLIPRIES